MNTQAQTMIPVWIDGGYAFIFTYFMVVIHIGSHSSAVILVMYDLVNPLFWSFTREQDLPWH